MGEIWRRENSLIDESNATYTKRGKKSVIKNS
jgi:hypothetical protein